MVKVKDIYACIEENKAPHIRLFDMNKQMLHVYDQDNNIGTAVEHMKTILPMYEGYGRIVVNCATPEMLNRKWANSYYLTCVFDKAAAQTTGAVQGPGFTPWTMPPGYVSNEVMLAKLEKIESDNRHNMEMFKLQLQMKESSEKDPFKQMEKAAPWLMYMTGKPLDEIGKVTQFMRLGNANLGNTGTAGPVVNSLTFKDLTDMPIDEKQKKFEALVRSLEKKVPIETMIQLYTAMDQDEDPNKLVQTALEAIPLLKNNK